MITTSLGRSVPRWMAKTSVIFTGAGRRSPVKVSLVRVTVRQLPQAAEERLNSLSAQLSAAPIPRFGSVCEDKVWRVPKLTNVSIVWRSCAWLTGWMMLRRRASGDGGGAAAISARLLRANILRIATLPQVGRSNWHLRDAGSRGAAILNPHR